MIELKGNYDLFNLPQNNEAICIPTNGSNRKNGCAIMNNNIAQQADYKFNLSARLGQYVNTYGNRAFNMGKCINGQNSFTVFTLPTKHHWKEENDVTLICKSCEQLVEMCNKFNITKCYLVSQSISNGKLHWENILKPWLQLILDDRFVVIT